MLTSVFGTSFRIRSCECESDWHTQLRQSLCQSAASSQSHHRALPVGFSRLSFRLGTSRLKKVGLALPPWQRETHNLNTKPGCRACELHYAWAAAVQQGRIKVRSS